MAKRPPKSLALDHDDDSAQFVGRTENGRQFFLTTPFIPSAEESGREFLALHLFDRAGKLLSATIDDLGPREAMDEVSRIVRRDALLASLGKLKFQRIKDKPFRIEMFGVEFGCIARPPEDTGDDWSVTVEPGDYMCFWPPWMGGDYDT